MSTNTGRFKPGQHWRKPREHWQRDWLEHEYVVKGRSAAEIADQQGITENAIFYWLDKLGIPRRTISEARQVKSWGLSGSDNGMHGKRGAVCPNWRGGITPARQSCYSHTDWATLIEVVWSRDGGRCQRCRCTAASRRRMHIHHLIPFEQCSDAQRIDAEVCLLLCSKCHGWVHSKQNAGRDFFMEGGATDV